MNLLLIRHGQTDWNLQKKLQGTEDIPLNDTGREQARHCARALSVQKWDAIYSSPLSRAVETADILSRYTNRPKVLVNPLLIEREFGEGSGITYEQLKAQYPSYPHETPPGMEPFGALCDRMEQAVKSCIREGRGENLIFVSHGGSINALLYRISNGTVGTGITTLKNTCINVLDYNPVSHILSIQDCNLSAEEYCLASLSGSYKCFDTVQT